MSGDVTVLQAPAAYTLDEVAQMAARALKAAGAERAVVFGSYARGTADGYSDLDLVVVAATDRPKLERGELLRELLEALPMAVDALLFTPKEFEEGMKRRGDVFEAIAREGVTIYARSTA
jgi:predicted nucleotidyltransferase